MTISLAKNWKTDFFQKMVPFGGIAQLDYLDQAKWIRRRSQEPEIWVIYNLVLKGFRRLMWTLLFFNKYIYTILFP